MTEAPRFTMQRAEQHQNRYAVCDQGDALVFCGHQRARRLTRFLNDWNPTSEQLATFLVWRSEETADYRAAMVRLTLRYAAVCVACGQPITEGTRARWHPDEGYVLHMRQCPLEVAA